MKALVEIAAGEQLAQLLEHVQEQNRSFDVLPVKSQLRVPRRAFEPHSLSESAHARTIPCVISDQIRTYLSKSTRT
jgi:hypothetical protein